MTEAAFGRTAVVVLGMHRSGTSALARVLDLLGCDLPQTLIPGRENDNPTGFWESQAVVDINEQICASSGSFWNDWMPLSQDWLASPVKDGFVERACGVLRSEFGEAPLFVLKDPRLCRVMPVWAEALERQHVRCVYILPLRNPFEVSASLRARNDITDGQAMLAWLRHVLDAERHSRGRTRVVTRYDALLSNWRGTVDRASEKLGLAWPNRSAASEEAIDAFLSADRRHQAVDDARVLDDARLSPWVRQCYEVMTRWARDDDRTGDTDILDGIRAALDEAAPTFERVVADAENSRKKGQMLEKDLATARKTVTDANSAITERDQTLEALRAEQARMETRCAELAQMLETAQGAARESGAALEAEQAARENISDELREARDALARRKEAERALQEQRDAAEEVRDQALHELEELRGRLAQTESALAQRRAELEETNGQIKQLQNDVSAKDNRIAELRADVEATRDFASRALRNVSEQARENLADRDARLSAAQSRIEQLQQRVDQEVETRTREISSQSRALLASYMTQLYSDFGLSGHSKLPQPGFIRRYRLKRMAERLRSSGFFDPDWYLQSNTDVAQAGVDPAQHFIQYGFAEGRPPKDMFRGAQ